MTTDSTARAPRAWVLNLDAELELEAGARYTPGAEMQARVTHLARGLKATMHGDDVVVAPEVGDVATPGMRGFAWCPTPRALELLRRAGAIVPDAPSLDTLRRAHERGFAFALAGDELPGVLRAVDADAVASHVAHPGPTGAWLLKRAFGVAGRGQRLVRPGPISDADRAWVLASLRRGAVYVEPRVELARELSVHAWARARTDVRSIREQRVAADRSWISSLRITSLEPAIERALVDTTERVGAALIESGYHGPFGIDAYQWRTSTGTLALRTLSEINPRYCMSWDAGDDWG